MNRYLITTADERTWKFDRPVVFLGEWCRHYDRKKVWENMDAVVAEPYGLGKNKKDEDYTKARNLEDKIFPMLCVELNKLHKTKHQERFWRIIIGHWLRHFTNVIFNRAETISYFLHTNDFIGVTAFSENIGQTCPKDLNEAVWFFNDSVWNNILYAKILLLLGKPIEKIEFVSHKSASIDIPKSLARPSIKKRVIKYFYRKLGKLTESLYSDEDAFIISSYLPKKEQIKLELALRQVPQFRLPNKLTLCKSYDHTLRQSLTTYIASTTDDKLLNIIIKLVFEYMPVCYIEGFQEVCNMANNLNWPKNPKFIFTSSNFYDDEIFKVWAGFNSERGVPYYTGAHGNYGVTKYELNPSIEEITSDKFLTWGWTDGLKQHTPAFIFKSVGKREKLYNPKGDLVLIELFQSLPIWTWDATAEHQHYFNHQLRFISSLKEIPKKNLTVRLHVASHALNWNEHARFMEFDPSIRVDLGDSTISELIAQSRLVVHSYDSTGILETMSHNIPTLAFWQNGFDHLRDSAKPFYQLLVDAGIVHLTPESIAHKVNDIWDNVDDWWARSEVQNAKNEFCNRYAVISKTPIRDLKKIFNSTSCN
jgi:putative transferase (TIGR04331 family)